MALIDELRQQSQDAEKLVEELNLRRLRLSADISNALAHAHDLSTAIAALEAPAQPLDELRSVPGAEEESRAHFDDGEAMRMAHSIMPGSGARFKTDEEIRASVRSLVPEGFTPHDGGDWKGNPRDAVQVVFESGAVSDVSHTVEDEARFWHWPWDGKSDRIVAFKIVGPAPIIEAPATEQDASVEIEPTTDLWQQGYDDRKNGFEPSLAEPDYLKGYEARKAIEDEQAATYEQARFFAEGMMADADRHQSDQRSIVEKIGGLFKREKEPA